MYKIIALTSEEPTDIVYRIKDDYYYHYETHDTPWDDIEYEYKQLYIISDEKIINNDFVLVENGKIPIIGKVIKIFDENLFEIDLGWSTTQTKSKFDCQKIISTTDKSLKLDLLSKEAIVVFNNNTDSEFDISHQMTEGWVPTYNNPDNYNLDTPAEPTGYIDIVIKEK